MRLISLRLLALCVVLPPACYILSLQGIESYARHRYSRQIETVLIGDAQPLIEGRVRLEERVAANVHHFVRSRRLPNWGLQLWIRVTTQAGRMIYPAPVTVDPLALVPEDPAATAGDNYRLLQEGLKVDLDLRLPHNTLLSNLLLVGYIGAALLVVVIHYRLALRQASKDAARTTDSVQRMERLSRRHRKLLESLVAEKARIAKDLDAVRQELDASRTSADRNEEAMIEEIVALEKRVEENLEQQMRQDDRIADLQEKLADYEKQQSRSARSRKRAMREVGKRFGALYKRTRFNERAIEGFEALPEEMKLRCEEQIYQLDHDPDQVTVKRKVFSKSRETFFELVFAYRGRLYFRKTAARGIEVVVIGTKNSQERDLAFLDSL